MTGEQRERELIAYMTGYESRNIEVQALREALKRVRGMPETFEWEGGGPSPDDVYFRGFEQGWLEAVEKAGDIAAEGLAGGETGEEK